MLQHEPHSFISAQTLGLELFLPEIDLSISSLWHLSSDMKMCKNGVTLVRESLEVC